MPDFRHVLMVTDLDATFFSHPSRLSPRNVEAIRYFTAHGGRFTAATGRIPPNIYKAIPDCATLFNAPAITANGSYIFDLATRTCVHGVPMDGYKAKEVAVFVQSLTDRVGVRVSTESGNLVNADRIVPSLMRDMGLIPDAKAVPGTDAYVNAAGEPVSGLADPTKLTIPPGAHSTVLSAADWDPAAEPWYKMVFRGEPDDLRALRPIVDEAYGDFFETNTSSPRFYELQAKGCNKATGLRWLADHLASEDGHSYLTVAVGDEENDLPMLRAADFSGCPSNATEAVWAVVDHHLCHCDEGCIADMIERVEAYLSENNRG